VSRLSREESRALTRAKLLASARDVVAREGYEGATIDRIAEEAGFTKGAFYANFSSKEEIVLELLEKHSLADVDEIAALLGDERDPLKIIDLISAWTAGRSRDPSWGLLALEMIRRAQRDATFGKRHASLFRAQWRGLGEMLLRLFPEGAAPATRDEGCPGCVEATNTRSPSRRSEAMRRTRRNRRHLRCSCTRTTTTCC
jgi:TetR/AcrR family transcriptional regulator, transcriptional repressor of aconitase